MRSKIRIDDARGERFYFDFIYELYDLIYMLVYSMFRKSSHINIIV